MTIRLESLSLLPNCLIDCGFKYLPRDIAYAKMAAMVTGAALVRTELGGASLSR